MAPNNIKEFEFLQPSFVPVLTSYVCDTLRNLRFLKAKNVSIEEIHYDTFKNCSELAEIDLRWNPIKKLPEETFFGLRHLFSLYLSHTVLPEISGNLFRDLKSMEYLELHSSSIVSLPPKVFEGMGELGYVSISSNELMDFDVEEAIKSLTNLYLIYLGDNNFRCDRLEEILAVFANRNVSVKSGVAKERIRYYEVQNINGIHCLSNDQWNQEIRKKTLAFPNLFKNVSLETVMNETVTKETIHTGNDDFNN